MVTAATLIGASLRCTLVTHAQDWSVGIVAPDTRLCAQCPASPPLQRPPCAASSAPDASGPGDGVYIFALQSLDFGIDPPAPGGSYLAGLNLDCSLRSAGAPTLCTGLTADGEPWVPLPDGIENAFGTVILGTIAHDPSIASDVQTQVNAELDAGVWGTLLVVDSWNGLPNDDSVGVRLLYAQLPAGVSSPSWDGTDSWDAFSEGYDSDFPLGEVPDTPFKAGGYVVGGVLVWDGRAIQGAELQLENHGAPQVLNLVSPELVGPMTTTGIKSASFGAIQPGAAAHLNTNFLADCDTQRACAISAKYKLGVADMNIPGTAGGGDCAGASVGMAMTFVRAQSIDRLIPTGRQFTCATPPTCPDGGS
jgi:hypothetical protein